MAQTKKKRRRKHRGTQAGTVQARGRSGGSATKADAKQISRQRREERLNRPPTWQSSINRAAVAAAIFGVLIVVAFHRPVASGAFLALFMFVLYIPLGYYTYLFIHRRRQARRK